MYLSFGISIFLPFTMPSGLRLKKQSISDNLNLQSQVPARSPPSSPRVEHIPQRAPYPIPSSDPASQYTLLEKLGTGSFGTVYKAMHNETKQIVAIKQIGMYNPCSVLSNSQ